MPEPITLLLSAVTFLIGAIASRHQSKTNQEEQDIRREKWMQKSLQDFWVDKERDFEEKLCEAEEKLNKANEDTEYYRKRVSDMNDSLAEATQKLLKLASLETQVNELQKRVIELKNTLDDLTKNYSVLQLELDRIKKERDTISVDLTKALKRNEELEIRLNECHKILERLGQEING